MIQWLRTVLISIVLIPIASVADQCPPENLLVSALVEGEWSLYLSDDKCQWQSFPTKSEPRVPALTLSAEKIAYVAASGDIREIDVVKGTDSRLVAANQYDTYTHLAYDPQGENLYYVLLKQGSSADSDIYRWHRPRSNVEPVITQRSAQFEPFLTPDALLFYGNVTCTVECGGVLQEVWEHDLTTGKARQLTLLNAVSRQPFVDQDSSTLVFSSNKDFYFHIWKQALGDTANAPVQLTSGNVVDVSPVLADDVVYFIRKQQGQSQLMRMPLKDDQHGEKAKLEVIRMVDGASDLKELRFGGA
ncbi:hypothetical protein OE749_16850 [Aestuariibacter sp. AA17]|uniref:Translocation protein TolB n=1 Tax=Fluctibacter corallii TaxID=2984329 RepID=A0ABT3ADQ0_9ALTE|nr:hypothetical protein [Aestuariibacter sp. AA17]MCV2886366.1 hypothetical protein [Aestuariibacter sp. AA17]